MKPFSLYLHVLLVSITLYLVSLSCKHDLKPVLETGGDATTRIGNISRDSTTPSGNKEESQMEDPSTMVLSITFAADVSQVKITPAPVKYNKKGWASIEWDDNSSGSLTGARLLAARTYTDGCGNPVPYSGALAVNGRNQYHNRELGLDDQGLSVTYTQMKTLIQQGWDIENHSYYHDPNGNYNYGNDRDRNVKELDQLIFDRIGYYMNGLVVPTNYDGFPTAAKNFGYLFSTSQGTFDNFPPANITYKDVQDFSKAPENFSSFSRIFYDNWDEMETSVKKAIDEISTKTNYYFRFASHIINELNCNNILNYFEARTSDTILMVSTREMMEYRIVSQQPITVKHVDNKTLKLIIDMKKIPGRFRWRDTSILIGSSEKITAVTQLNNIDSTSFNPETGLINIFSQKTKWDPL